MVAGDLVAFARWVAGAESSVRWSLRPFAALLDCEAVLQEAFLRVWQVVPKFRHDGRPHALLRFTITTARNVALSELRRANSAGGTGPNPSAIHDTLDALERELSAEAHVAPTTPDPFLRQAIATCREKLPKQPALALEQRLLANGTEADLDLAARLNMSLNTFLQNFSRARKFLAECLKKAGVDLDAELAP